MPLYIPTSADPSTNGFRLTTETGVPVSTSDRTGQTTLYLTPYFSGAIALYILGKWTLKLTSEVSFPIGTRTSDKNFDVYAYWDGSAVALELDAWFSDTSRVASLSTQDGVYTKPGDAARRYIGTVRTTSTTTIEDSAAKRFIWNGPEPWRQIPRAHVSPPETTNSWSGVVGWRQANGNTANKVETVVGLASSASIDVLMSSGSGNNGTQAMPGIGIDSTTTDSSHKRNCPYSDFGQIYFPSNAKFVGTVSEGYHAFNWLENSNNTNAVIHGDVLGALAIQSGLTASVPG